MVTDPQAGSERKPLPVTLTAIFAAVLILDRVVFHLFAGPLPDEAYYWLWGQHLDWSYFDHPPLQAWLQSATTLLLGNNLFALRVPALLTSAILIGCILWWVRKLGDDGIVLRRSEALLATFSAPLVYIFAEMVFNDHLLLALLAIASICLRTTLDAVARTGTPRLLSLYGAALAAGLAMLTKYNAALFVLGVLPVLFFRPYRPLWRSPHLYVALAVALACLIPIAVWNLNHSGASLQYNLVDRVGFVGIQGFAQGALTFLIGFLVALSPFLVAPLIRLVAQRAPASPWQSVAATIFIVSTLACVAVSAFTFTLYYWNIVAIVAMFPLIVAYFRTRIGLIAHLAFGALCATAFTINYAVVPLAALSGTIDSESGIVYDWPEIATEARSYLAQTGTGFLAASDYRHGSILAFTTDDRHVEVFSDRKSQFDFWRDDAALSGRDAVVVTDLWHPMSAEIQRHFSAVTKLGGHDVVRFGHLIAHYDFYRATSYRP
jgi:4-amino-4-deoxy-L-arabinose transferase-like glycosyltransferase